MDVQQVWGEQLPTRIYKYMEHKYAQALCEQGQIRLRGLESYDSDPDEGRQIAIAGTVTCEEFQDRGQAAENIRTNTAGLISFGPSATGSMIINSKFKRSLGNLLVFCASTQNSLETMRRSNSSPGVISKYDTCVEIFDVQSFIAVLTNAISARTQVVQRCISGCEKYQTREHSIRELPATHGFEPAFVKPIEFSVEREYRILWQWPIKAGTFLDIECPELAAFCYLRGLATAE